MSYPPGMPSPGQPFGQPFGGQPLGYQPTQPVPQPVAVPGGPAAVAPSGEPVLVSIGDISVTPTQVYTPRGSLPLAQLQWSVTDLSATSQIIPTWAIVCAIVFIPLCFVGLLFLLAKETITQGSVQVTVSGPGVAHTTQIPVTSMAQVADIAARVNYVRSLTAGPPPGPAPGPAPGPPPGPAPGPAPGQGT